MLNTTALSDPAALLDDEVAVNFFQGVVWGGAVTLLVSLAFRFKGSATPPGFKEIVPAWGYEANAFINAGWTSAAVVFLSIDAARLVGSGACAGMEDVLRSRGALDYFIFGGIFGAMAKDGLLFSSTLDPILVVHHIGTMFLCVQLTFNPVFHGLRMCTYTAVFIEMGSSCYCCFVMWGLTTLYSWGMTISNVLTALCLAEWMRLNADLLTLSTPAPAMCLAAAGMTVARQYMMHVYLAADERALQKPKKEQ